MPKRLKKKRTLREPLPDRLPIYETLFSFNRNFGLLLQDLDRLTELASFRSRPKCRFLKSCQVKIEETRAWTNFEVLEALIEMEESEWTRLGQLSQRQIIE